MKINKSSILFGTALACFCIFIISFFQLITGDASDASQNYGFSLSMIAGIVISIPTIIEIFRQYKKSDKKGFISFFINSFKKENGKYMSNLVWALFFSIFPIFILGAVLIFCSAGSATSSSSSTSSSSGGNRQTNNSNNNSRSESSERHRELNHIAGSTGNNMQQITESKHNEIQKIVNENPSISDEELAERARVNVETARAHRPTGNMSYQEINHVAGSNRNNIQQITESKHNEIQKIVNNNPGISDEELAEKTRVNVETARAHRPVCNMTYQEINHIAGNTSNNINQITEGLHNEIQKTYRKNPGLSDEEVLEIFRKSHPSMNIETIRAHKPF